MTGDDLVSTISRNRKKKSRGRRSNSLGHLHLPSEYAENQQCTKYVGQTRIAKTEEFISDSGLQKKKATIL
jgi:hypothetical protein